MTSGKCPHPWNKEKKGTFTDGHKNSNIELRGCFKKGHKETPTQVLVRTASIKKAYEEARHIFNKINCLAQQMAKKSIWYDIGKASWKKLSKNILERDKYQCQSCGIDLKNKKHQCHHIIPYKISKDNSPMNLTTLCTSCHARGWNRRRSC